MTPTPDSPVVRQCEGKSTALEGGGRCWHRAKNGSPYCQHHAKTDHALRRAEAAAAIVKAAQVWAREVGKIMNGPATAESLLALRGYVARYESLLTESPDHA